MKDWLLAGIIAVTLIGFVVILAVHCPVLIESAISAAILGSIIYSVKVMFNERKK